MDGFIPCEHCGVPMAAWRQMCPECRYDRQTGRVHRGPEAAAVLQQLTNSDGVDTGAERQAEAAVQRATGSGCGGWVGGVIGVGLLVAGVVFFPLQVIAASVVGLVVWLVFFRKP